MLKSSSWKSLFRLLPESSGWFFKWIVGRRFKGFGSDGFLIQSLDGSHWTKGHWFSTGLDFVTVFLRPPTACAEAIAVAQA